MKWGAPLTWRTFRRINIIVEELRPKPRQARGFSFVSPSSCFLYALGNVFFSALPVVRRTGKSQPVTRSTAARKPRMLAVKRQGPAEVPMQQFPL